MSPIRSADPPDSARFLGESRHFFKRRCTGTPARPPPYRSHRPHRSLRLWWTTPPPDSDQRREHRLAALALATESSRVGASLMVHGHPWSIHGESRCGIGNAQVVRGLGAFCKSVAKATQVRMAALVVVLQFGWCAYAGLTRRRRPDHGRRASSSGRDVSQHDCRPPVGPIHPGSAPVCHCWFAAADAAPRRVGVSW
jgi:hypothetical protein